MQLAYISEVTINGENKNDNLIRDELQTYNGIYTDAIPQANIHFPLTR